MPTRMIKPSQYFSQNQNYACDILSISFDYLNNWADKFNCLIIQHPKGKQLQQTERFKSVEDTDKKTNLIALDMISTSWHPRDQLRVVMLS